MLAEVNVRELGKGSPESAESGRCADQSVLVGARAGKQLREAGHLLPQLATDPWLTDGGDVPDQKRHDGTVFEHQVE